MDTVRADPSLEAGAPEHPLLPNPQVAVDVVLFTIRQGELQALLVRREAWPHAGAWALPGGFVRPNEALHDAAQRELRGKTGLTDLYLEQLYTFGDPHRDPRGRVISVTYFSLVDNERLNLSTHEGGPDARWFAVCDLPPLAFDHDLIVDTARARLKTKLEYTNMAFTLLPEQFTLTELQRVYESILGRPLDKRNFRKRMLSLDLLRSVGATRRSGPHRPAALYAFKERHLAFLD